jgi:hypothetical protein
MLIIIVSKGNLFFPLLALYILFGLVRYILQEAIKLYKKTEVEPEKTSKYSSIDL